MQQQFPTIPPTASLPPVGPAAGSYPFPEDVTIDAQGRVVVITAGLRPNAPVLIGKLGDSFGNGTWNPDETLGHDTTTSSASISDLAGSYVCGADRERFFYFSWFSYSPPGSDLYCEFLVRDLTGNWNPVGWTFTKPAGQEYVFEATKDIILVRGEQLAVRLHPFFGYTPKNCKIWALREDRTIS